LRGQATFPRFEKVACPLFFLSSAQLLDTAIEMGRLISQNDPRMVQGIKRLLHDDIALPWRERFDSEQSARKTTLKATLPARDSKNSSSAREFAGEKTLSLLAYGFDPIIGLIRARPSEPPIRPSGSVALLWKRLS